MAAGRGIIATNAGGMADMLDEGENEVGKLIPPRSSAKIAEAAIALLADPKLRMKLGQAARERLVTQYSAERISELQEASYSRAIQRRQLEGKRLY